MLFSRLICDTRSSFGDGDGFGEPFFLSSPSSEPMMDSVILEADSRDSGLSSLMSGESDLRLSLDVLETSSLESLVRPTFNGDSFLSKDGTPSLIKARPGPLASGPSGCPPKVLMERLLSSSCSGPPGKAPGGPAMLKLLFLTVGGMLSGSIGRR